MKNKLTFAIAGLGSRGYNCYAEILKGIPEKAEVVAIAEPKADRLNECRERFGIPENMCFESAEELLKREKLADVLIIATLDRMHFKEAVTALEKGYDLLLEKPISINPAECKIIADTANKYGRKVVVCHVLRYTPFFKALKKIISEGSIGKVMSIQAMERVCYWHQAHSFVRGNWRDSNTTSSMILQKCSHDMDIYLWLAGKNCKTVSSFGELSYFISDNAPQGATEYCSQKCSEYDTCVYNPYRYYGNILKKGYTWPVDVVIPRPDENLLTEALKNGPYGKCVFLTDNNVVDHQIVNLLLEDDITVSFTMCAFTATSGRKMMIMGTEGHIEGFMEDNYIKLCRFGEPEKVINYQELGTDVMGHGGGDSRMIYSLIDYILEGKTDNSISTIDRSVESHYVAMAAEESRINAGKAINIADFIASVSN